MLTFGLTQPKVKKVEKYPDHAVMTYIGGDGTKNFLLNKKALELLGYSERTSSDKISLGYTEDGKFFIANTTGMDTRDQAHLTAKDYFASSPLVSKIEKENDQILGEGTEFPLLMSADSDSEVPFLILSEDNMHVILENSIVDRVMEAVAEDTRMGRAEADAIEDAYFETSN